MRSLGFQDVLELDLTCTEAADELASVRSLLALTRSRGRSHGAKYGDSDYPSDSEIECELVPIVSSPALDESDRDTPFESDSSDFHQQGFGIPCRYYIHAGCARGRECKYKHTPDNRSVRNYLYVSSPRITAVSNISMARAEGRTSASTIC